MEEDGGQSVPLKEYFEEKFRSLERERVAEARALVIQAAEYERRLTALNGEQGRIAANQSISVSREIWDRSQAEDREWKRRIDTALADKLPRAEFQTYKEVTDKALTLKAGESQGVARYGALLLALLTAAAAVGLVIVDFMRR